MGDLKGGGFEGVCGVKSGEDPRKILGECWEDPRKIPSLGSSLDFPGIIHPLVEVERMVVRVVVCTRRVQPSRNYQPAQPKNVVRSTWHNVSPKGR